MTKETQIRHSSGDVVVKVNQYGMVHVSSPCGRTITLSNTDAVDLKTALSLVLMELNTPTTSNSPPDQL